MATRRTPDTTRSPKAAASTTEPSAPAAAKPATTKPVSTKPVTTKRASKPKTVPPVIAAQAVPEVSEDVRRAMIAESAYLRAERRGFAPGHEEEDWIAAEKEVDALLSAKTGIARQ